MERPLPSILLTIIVLAAQSFVKVTAEGDFITQMQNKSREMRSQTLQMPLLKIALQSWYQSEACPSPWIMFKGLCLLVRWDHPSHVGHHWFLGEAWCNARGGFLVYFKNEPECKILHDFLAKTRPNKWIHIGLYVEYPQIVVFTNSGIQFGGSDLDFLGYISLQRSNRRHEVFQIFSRPDYKSNFFLYYSSKYRLGFTVCRRAL